MRIDTRIVGDDVILTLPGHVADLNWTINDVMRQSHRRRFLVDLQDVSVLDSEALHEIVRAYINVSRRGGSLKLLNLNENIKELLSIIKLSFLFEGAEGDEQAGIGSRLKPRKPVDGEAMRLAMPAEEPQSG